MNIQAEQKFIRISPRKLRLVTQALKSLTPEQAVEELKYINKSGSDVLSKVITQAIANAASAHNIQPSALRFKGIQINEGPTYKRWQSVSRGRAHSIFKRTSHIVVELTSAPNPLTTPGKTPTMPEKTAPTPKTSSKKSPLTSKKTAKVSNQQKMKK